MANFFYANRHTNRQAQRPIRQKLDAPEFKSGGMKMKVHCKRHCPKNTNVPHENFISPGLQSKMIQMGN